jgi:hypothetical protein
MVFDAASIVPADNHSMAIPANNAVRCQLVEDKDRVALKRGTAPSTFG